MGQAKRVEAAEINETGELSEGTSSEEFAPDFEAPEEKGAAAPLTNEGMIESPAGKIQLQPRTMGIPHPKKFYFEPAKALRKDPEKGNDHNQISSGVHQVDPNRRVSFNPVMPNLKLLKESGNPFPKTGDDPTVTTTKTWQPFVAFAHALYGQIKAQTEPFIAKDLLEKVCKTSKVGLDAKGQPTSTARKVMVDTLRDLRCYGIVVSDSAKHNFRSTKWALVEKPEKIPFVAPKK